MAQPANNPNTIDLSEAGTKATARPRTQIDLTVDSSKDTVLIKQEPTDDAPGLSRNILARGVSMSSERGDRRFSADTTNGRSNTLRLTQPALSRKPTGTVQLKASSGNGPTAGMKSIPKVKGATADQNKLRSGTLTPKQQQHVPFFNHSLLGATSSSSELIQTHALKEPPRAIKIESDSDGSGLSHVASAAPTWNGPDHTGQKRGSLGNKDGNDGATDRKKRIRLTFTTTQVAEDEMVSPKKAPSTTIAAQVERIKAQASSLPGADPTQINKDNKALQQARGAFGHHRIKAVPPDMWLVKGMKTPLFHHQLYSTSWMLGREKSQELPHGGVLADEMGFGKTIMFLALIKSNPTTGGTGCSHVTLVIVPNGQVIELWHRQIRLHCPALSFRRYTRKERLSEIDLAKVDVLFTTYSEMLRAYASEPDSADDIVDLFETRFGRIILDECHEMKNYRGKTAEAAFQIRAQYKWCCSATPIPNGAKELYPYMKFVGLPRTNTILEWNATYGAKSGEVGQERLDKVIKDCMMRRSYDAEFFGTPVLDSVPPRHFLPPSIVPFSEEERVIYELVRKEYRVRVNEHLNSSKKKGKGKCGDVLALLNRLRELTAHVFLLEGTMRDDIQLESIRKIRAHLEGISDRKPLIDQIGRWCANQPNGSTTNPQGRVAKFGKSRHGLEFDMTPQLRMLEAVRAKAERDCAYCGKASPDGLLAQCGHIFHNKCLDKLLRINSALKKEPATCLRCEGPIGHCTPLKEEKDDFADDASSLSAASSMRTPGRPQRGRKRKPRMRGDDYNGVQPRGMPSEFLAESDRNPAVPLTPSAKTTALKDIILRFQEEAPDDKIIVFTQWIIMTKIIGRMLEDEGIPFVYYVGELTEDEKRGSLNTFRNVEEVKVMVALLQCAGQSLDLTCANRVILVDLWWNENKEEQAFSRVYRIGQKKETYCVRIIVKDSVDDFMNEVQLRKTAEINRTLQEVGDSDKAKLDVFEMASVFGRVVEGEDGGIVVESDDDMDDSDMTED